jgi:hypothetical protein
MTRKYRMPIEPQVSEAIDHFRARVRHDVDVRATDLNVELVKLLEAREEHWRLQLDRTAAEARAEVERTFPARLAALRDEWTREAAPSAVAARDLAAPGELTGPGGREADPIVLGRLLGAVRRIDEAATLTGILEALARATATEARRAAVMLVDDDMLRAWRYFGFESTVAPMDIPVSRSGFVTAAMALRQTSFVQPSVGVPDPASPAFMHVPAGHTGLVAPIVVDTEVVAVLYADDVGRPPAQEEAPLWAEVVQLLVRFAAVRLENVTSIRTVGLLSQPV